MFIFISQFQAKRRSTIKDVTAVEVTWQPQNMLTDMSCFDMDQTALLFRTSSSEEWQRAEAEMRPAGQASKWTLKVKPCLRYEFAIKVSGEGEAQQTLQQAVGPATEEEIRSSGFVPDAPQGFVAQGREAMEPCENNMGMGIKGMTLKCFCDVMSLVAVTLIVTV